MTPASRTFSSGSTPKPWPRTSKSIASPLAASSRRRRPLWALRAEADGRLPRGLYTKLLEIGFSESGEEQDRIAADIVKRFPRSQPVYLELAKRSREAEEALAWIDLGLEADPDIETYGVLRLNRAGVLRSTGERRGRRRAA